MASIINASSTGSGGLISTGDASGVLQLQSNGTVAVSVTGSAVTFAGQATFNAAGANAVFSANAADTGIQIISTATGGRSMSIYASGTGSGNIPGAGLYFYDNTASKIALAIDSSDNINIYNGNLQFKGNNYGITFQNSSALTNSTLNDYETGTWTPNITAGAGSLTAYTSGGYYVKVGRLVMVTGYFQITTAGTASGAAVYSNLPFNLSGASANAGQIAFVVRESQATGTMYSGYAQGGSAGGALYSLAGGGPIAWTNTYTYPFAFSYYASF